MIRLTEFRVLLETTRGNPFNTGHWDVIRAGPSACLHVVAGPGMGKTTSLVSPILKLIFVDQLPPGSILATTFTNKAAEELRSRILSQGMALKDAIGSSDSVGHAAKSWANERSRSWETMIKALAGFGVRRWSSSPNFRNVFDVL